MEAAQTQAVARSVRAYGKAHRDYERRHPEIFNPVEQQRLRAAVADALALSAANGRAPRVLDLGCGSGNLSAHFLALGAHVVAADVSPHFLELASERFGATDRFETLLLNGTDLRNVPPESFDVVAAYSVLHHIPDYLGALDEIATVLRPGGIAYIDHEASEAYWRGSEPLAAFRSELRAAALAQRSWRRFVTPAKYRQAFLELGGRLRLRLNPRYQAEGDLHVFPDDHIEWDRVVERLTAAGLEVVERRNYLVFRADYPREVYERWAPFCDDMTMLVARKRD